MQTNIQLNYSSQFKTKVVFELLLSGMSIQDISNKYQVSVSSIVRWEKQLISNASAIFSRKTTCSHEEKEIKVLEKTRDKLLKSISHLKRKKVYFPKEEGLTMMAKKHLQHLSSPMSSEHQGKNIYFRLIS